MRFHSSRSKDWFQGECSFSFHIQISQVTSLISAKLEKEVARITALVTAVMIISFLPVIVLVVLSGVFLVLRKRWAMRLPEILMQFNIDSEFTNLLLWRSPL